MYGNYDDWCNFSAQVILQKPCSAMFYLIVILCYVFFHKQMVINSFTICDGELKDLGTSIYLRWVIPKNITQNTLHVYVQLSNYTEHLMYSFLITQNTLCTAF